MLEPTKVAVQPKYNRKILVKESNPENFMVQNEEHILTHLKTACFHMFSTCSPWSKLSSLRYPRQMFALHSPPCPGVTSLQVLLGSECRSDPFTMEIFNMRSWITIIKHLPSSCHSLLSTRRSHTWPYWPIPPGPRNWCQPPPATATTCGVKNRLQQFHDAQQGPQRAIRRRGMLQLRPGRPENGLPYGAVVEEMGTFLGGERKGG